MKRRSADIGHLYPILSSERNTLMEFFSGYPFMIIMGLLLVGLIGLYLYLRKQQSDD